MTPLTRWFNRPRKNSSPTRLALSEFMNISSGGGGSQQKFTFPPSNKYEPTKPSRTPMLITSSFYNKEYPFDTNDESSADGTVSRPITPDIQPQHQTMYNQQTSYAQEPTQRIDIPRGRYTDVPQHNSMPPLTSYNIPPSTHYINIPPPSLSQYNMSQTPQTHSIPYAIPPPPSAAAAQTQYAIPPPSLPMQYNQPYAPRPSTIRSDDTFNSHEQLPRKSRYRSTQERVPTPYIMNTNQIYPDKENQQIKDGKRFSATDIADFEKLKNDFKELEKKHNQREKRLQKLEYIMYSKSLESKNPACYYGCDYYYYYQDENERRLRDYYIQQQKWDNDVRKKRPF